MIPFHVYSYESNPKERGGTKGYNTTRGLRGNGRDRDRNVIGRDNNGYRTSKRNGTELADGGYGSNKKNANCYNITQGSNYKRNSNSRYSNNSHLPEDDQQDQRSDHKHHHQYSRNRIEPGCVQRRPQQQQYQRPSAKIEDATSYNTANQENNGENMTKVTKIVSKKWQLPNKDPYLQILQLIVDPENRIKCGSNIELDLAKALIQSRLETRQICENIGVLFKTAAEEIARLEMIIDEKDSKLK